MGIGFYDHHTQCPSFQLLLQLTDSEETWHEHNANRRIPQLHTSEFPQISNSALTDTVLYTWVTQYPCGLITINQTDRERLEKKQ